MTEKSCVDCYYAHANCEDKSLACESEEQICDDYIGIGKIERNTINKMLEIIHELEQDNIGSEACGVDYNVACRDILDRIKATQMFEEMIDDGVFAEEETGMKDKEFMFYMISPSQTAKPDGTRYETFKIAKAAAERFSNHYNCKYYVIECCMVCNTVSEIGCEQE